MKKTFVMKAIAAIFATTMMSFTTAAEASAQNTFVYGQDGNTMTVSTLNADGLSITPKLKYEYQYDANGIYMIDYAEYDKASGAFTQNIQTSIYYQQAESDLLLTEVQR